MITDGDQPQADNGQDKSAKKHHCWQWTCMFTRFGCWAAISIRNPDNIPVYLNAIVTAFLVAFAYYAWDEATRGTTAMKDAQRPWVGAPTEIKPSVAPGGNVTFIQIFRNVGRTPTKGFYIDGKIIPGKLEGLNSEVQNMCKTATEAVAKSIGPFAIIPGGDWYLDVAAMPTSKDRIFTIESLKKMGDPNIIGCVLYGSPFDTIIHKTGYMARIDIVGYDARIPFIYAVNAE